MNVIRRVPSLIRCVAILVLVLLTLSLESTFGLRNISIVTAHPQFSSTTESANQLEGLIAWWPADGHSNDTVGRYHARPFGNATFGTGKIGQAFKLDGKSLSHFAAPFVHNGPFSISLWVKSETLDQTEFTSVLSTGKRNPPNGFFQIDYAGSRKGSDYRVTSGEAYTNVPSFGRMETTFQHLLLAYDGSTARAYVNGVLADEVLTERALSFERIKIGINRGDNRPFKGLIDEIQIYARALSKQEVKLIFDSVDQPEIALLTDPTPTEPEQLPPATDCRPGEPCAHLYATNTRVLFINPILLNLSIVNSIAKPPMTAQLIMQVPSGWALSGSGFSDACTGQCSAVYKVEPGGNRSIEFTLQPNEAGTFEINARLDWFFGGDKTTIEGKNLSTSVTVEPSVPPTPTPSPTGTPAPKTSGSGGGGAGGCSLIPGSAITAGLPNLVLLVGPLLGMIGWRRILRSKRG